MIKRCGWEGSDPLYISYHDREWGVPVHDDRVLFEFLILEGAQAGLSWITILNKRNDYRRAFDSFDPHKVAGYDEVKISELMSDKGIIRNRRKILSAVNNARCFIKIKEEFGSFDSYIWDFVDGAQVQNSWAELSEVPAFTPLSKKISKDLKSRGFSFVGPTIIYSLMQAVGMVNDHVTSCFRYGELKT